MMRNVWKYSHERRRGEEQPSSLLCEKKITREIEEGNDRERLTMQPGYFQLYCRALRLVWAPFLGLGWRRTGIPEVYRFSATLIWENQNLWDLPEAKVYLLFFIWCLLWPHLSGNMGYLLGSSSSQCPGVTTNFRVRVWKSCAEISSSRPPPLFTCYINQNKAANTNWHFTEGHNFIWGAPDC